MILHSKRIHYQPKLNHHIFRHISLSVDQKHHLISYRFPAFDELPDMRQLTIEVYNSLSMNANSSQNTVEDESLSQSYDLWEAKFNPSSLARQSRSRISKRSRFTCNSKLLKSYLFKSIIQKNSKQVLQQSQQMDLQLELLQSAIDNLRRENDNQKYKMGQFFLNHSLQGQLAFSQLREQ